MSHWDSLKLWERLRKENPAAGHLNECPHCVDRLAVLKEFELLMAALRHPAPAPGRDCISAEELAGYMEFRHADRGRIKAHMQECDHCFQNAAYYFGESLAMKAAPEETTPEPVLRAALDMVPKRSWVDRWFIAPLPAWAAAALFLLFFTLTSPTFQLTMTKDAPFYSIFEKEETTLPYFYFTGDGKKVGSEVSGMRVTTSRGRVQFRWNEMPLAEEYYFVLQEIKDGAPRRIDERFIKGNTLTLKASDLAEGNGYRWLLAGRLPDDRYFQGTMEFTVER